MSIKSKVRAGARCLELTLYLSRRDDLVVFRDNKNGIGTFTERQAEVSKLCFHYSEMPLLFKM